MEIKDRLYIAKNMKSLAGIDEERERVLAVVITKQMEKEMNQTQQTEVGWVR